MHTHTPDGVIHVESPVNKDYVLGQFFGEWGVRLTSSCVANYCGKLNWWVDGKKRTGNPADIVLTSHEEIAIAYGTPPKKIPTPTLPRRRVARQRHEPRSRGRSYETSARPEGQGISSSRESSPARDRGVLEPGGAFGSSWVRVRSASRPLRVE